jgi:hypothetical protein
MVDKPSETSPCPEFPNLAKTRPEVAFHLQKHHWLFRKACATTTVIRGTKMSAFETISFKMEDRIDGVEITPETIGFARFNRFNKEVEDFIKGGARDIQLIEFAGKPPSYNEDELSQAIKKGTRAWADVENITDWVAEQRGTYDA